MRALESDSRVFALTKAVLHRPEGRHRQSNRRENSSPHRLQSLAVTDPKASSQDGSTPPTAAAFFDLDKTIIARSSTLAFSRPFYDGGLITRRAVLRSAYAHFILVIKSVSKTNKFEEFRIFFCIISKLLQKTSIPAKSFSNNSKDNFF